MKTFVMGAAFAAMMAVGCSSSTDDTPAATPDAGTADTGTSSGGTCTAAKQTLLGPIASASTGDVTVLGADANTKTIFVDASAGGPQAAATSPRLYLNLETLTRVDVSDVDADSSTAWDLAIKRPILFTNSGDGGSGQGGSALLDGVDYATVTNAMASAATFKTESFFDASCNPQVDETGAVLTSFNGWYDYDLSTNLLSPHPGTWVVKGGTGKLYKIAILTYYANTDGTPGMTGGRFTIKVEAL